MLPRRCPQLSANPDQEDQIQVRNFYYPSVLIPSLSPLVTVAFRSRSFRPLSSPPPAASPAARGRWAGPPPIAVFYMVFIVCSDECRVALGASTPPLAVAVVAVVAVFVGGGSGCAVSSNKSKLPLPPSRAGPPHLTVARLRRDFHAAIPVAAVASTHAVAALRRSALRLSGSRRCRPPPRRRLSSSAFWNRGMSPLLRRRLKLHLWAVGVQVPLFVNLRLTRFFHLGPCSCRASGSCCWCAVRRRRCFGRDSFCPRDFVVIRPSSEDLNACVGARAFIQKKNTSQEILHYTI